MTHPSIIPCQRGFVARRRVDDRVQYMGRDLRWEDSLGLSAECVVTRVFGSERKAWGGLIAWAYQNERDEAQRMELARHVSLSDLFHAVPGLSITRTAFVTGVDELVSTDFENVMVADELEIPQPGDEHHEVG